MEAWLVTGSSLAEIAAYFLSQLKGQYAEVGKISSLTNHFHFVLIAKKMPSDVCLCYFRISKYERYLVVFQSIFKKKQHINHFLKVLSL